MKLIHQSHEILHLDADPLKLIEVAGRTCYRSEDKICEGSDVKFTKMLLGRHHESVIEHSLLTVRFITNRGVTHELVRHRLNSFSQESTRYVSSVEKRTLEVTCPGDVVKAYTEGFSMREVAERSSGKYTEGQVNQILRAEGTPKRGLNSKGLRNQSAFRVIDTAEKAYLFGMLITDGNMRRGSNQITITQHRDYAWAYKALVKHVVGGQIGEGKDRQCVSISFSGEEIANDLRSKGMVPNKSYEFTEENAQQIESSIPDEFAPDFLRGLLDGDGCIRFFNQRGERSVKGSAHMSFCGPDHLMRIVQKWVHSWTGKTVRVRQDPQSKVLFRLNVTDKVTVVILCHLMYKNFKMPFGHPKKASRVFEALPDLGYSWASWGDPQFKCILPEPTLPVSHAAWIFASSLDYSELAYSRLRLLGWTPQQAREVLPNALKTEIVMSGNFRSWRHVLIERTSKAAHPQMRALMIPLLAELKTKVPVIFDDINP